LLKKFLEKIINLQLIKEIASFRQSHVTAPHFRLAGLSPKPAATFNGNSRALEQKSPLGVGGENGLGRHLEPPPPHSREFFSLPHSP
jgi:hypothetical protein